tara:strand:- start:748 stop:921 length:174 start_codon:yes stop_codon:yes gene_type:complete
MADRIDEGCKIGLHPWGPWREQGGTYRRECKNCAAVDVQAFNPEPPDRTPFNPYADL